MNKLLSEKDVLTAKNDTLSSHVYVSHKLNLG